MSEPINFCFRNHRLNSKWRRLDTSASASESKGSWLLQPSRQSRLYTTGPYVATYSSSPEQGTLHIFIWTSRDLHNSCFYKSGYVAQNHCYPVGSCALNLCWKIRKSVLFWTLYFSCYKSQFLFLFIFLSFFLSFFLYFFESYLKNVSQLKLTESGWSGHFLLSECFSENRFQFTHNSQKQERTLMENSLIEYLSISKIYTEYVRLITWKYEIETEGRKWRTSEKCFHKLQYSIRSQLECIHHVCSTELCVLLCFDKWVTCG
jgi:hypothetical protein